MRIKSIALWVMAVVLAAVLFYLFRDEMVQKDVRQVGLAVLSSGGSAGS